MFRALDASTLFCIGASRLRGGQEMLTLAASTGIFVQEHVAKMIDQPLHLSLGPEMDALGDDELQRRYAQELQLLEQEDEDDVEREVRRRMATR